MAAQRVRVAVTQTAVQIRGQAVVRINTGASSLGGDLTALEALSTTGIVVRTTTDTYATRTLQAPAAGLTIANPAGLAGDPTFALANDLAGLEGLSGTGVAVRTGDGTWTTRSVVAGTGITIGNGGGSGGDITVSLSGSTGPDLAAIEALTGTGLAARTADDTWALRTMSAPAAGLTITNPGGVAGDPTFALANDLAALEGLSTTGAWAKRTAADTWVLSTPTAAEVGADPAGTAEGLIGAMLSGIFGTGSDGSHTVVGTETLTEEVHYTDLTVSVGTTIRTDGFRILCTGTLTNNGTIHDDGNDASGAIQGGVLTAQGVRVQAASATAGRNTTGNGSNAGAVGTNAYAYNKEANNTGGNGGSVTSGNGGTGSTAATTLNGGPGWKPVTRVIGGDTTIHLATNTKNDRFAGAGAAGGCNVGTGTAVSGGGGGAAGVVQVLCRVLSGSGVFRAQGGDGGNASATGNGAAGGGGGATGGRVEVVAGTLSSWTGTYTCPGGAAGSSISATVAATDGGAGTPRLYTLME